MLLGMCIVIEIITSFISLFCYVTQCYSLKIFIGYDEQGFLMDPVLKPLLHTGL